jgi:hypothetical protein
VLRGEVVDEHAVHLNRNTRTHGDDATRVHLEGLITDQEVHVLRRSRVTVRSDRETADEHVTHAKLVEGARRRAHFKPHWASICADCVGGIDSLVDLGRLSEAVMQRICATTCSFKHPAALGGWPHSSSSSRM